MSAGREYQIDVSQIWAKEVANSFLGIQEKTYYDELYDYLKFFFLLKGHDPFISKELLLQDPYQEPYYNNYLKRLSLADMPIDFFKYGDAFYDMAESCIIQPKDVATRDFIKLFRLQLNQYPKETPKETLAFLSYQWKANFSGDLLEFEGFINQVLALESDILESTQRDRIITWMEMSQKETIEVKLGVGTEQVEANASIEESETPVECSAPLSTPESKSTPTESSQNTKGSFSTQGNAAIDQEPIVLAGQPVPGDFTKEEILHYFSFLYYHKNEIDGSFLKKEEVEEMFQEGIFIPKRPRHPRFKLNITNRFPKKIVNYFIHTFYVKYNVKAKDSILLFFGSYLEDYANALDPSKLNGIKSNLTGEKPQNKTLSPLNYLPERFR
jgi:hypothetical protein